MRLPWPFHRNDRVSLVRRADEDDFDPGLYSNPTADPATRGAPPAHIIAKEPWASDFNPRMNPAHRELLRKIWNLNQIVGQRWVVKKKIWFNHRSNFRLREVAAFPSYPTTEQIEAAVGEHWGAGAYHIWATKPQPPIEVFSVVVPGGEGVDEEPESAPNRREKPASGLSGAKAEIEARAIEGLTADPNIMAQIGAAALARAWGIDWKPPAQPAADSEDAAERAFLAAHPEIRDKAAAARLAKKYGLKTKDLLPSVPGAGNSDDEDEFTRIEKFLGRARKMQKLLGLGGADAPAQPAKPGLMDHIGEGIGQMIGNLSGDDLRGLLGGLLAAGRGPAAGTPTTPEPGRKLLPAPPVAGTDRRTAQSGLPPRDDAGESITFTESRTPPQPPQPAPAPASKAPPVAATVPVTAEGVSDTMPATENGLPPLPTSGPSYKHLLAETFTAEGLWTEYPPSATVDEALAKIKGLINGDEAVSWLMGLDWRTLQTALQESPPQFVQWLGRKALAQEHGWSGLFSVLSSMHPRSMLLVFRKGLSIPLIKLSPAGEVCQALLTPDGAKYLTYAMALCHETAAKYGIGAEPRVDAESRSEAAGSAAGSAAGAASPDLVDGEDSDDLEGMR